MPRILHIVESLNRNGTETFIINVSRELNKSGFEFDFLIFKDQGRNFNQEITELGSTLFLLPHRRKGIVEYHKGLAKFFKEHSRDYDIVHMHGMSYTSIAPLVYAKKFTEATTIFHLHGRNCRGFHNLLLHHINSLRIKNIADEILGCSPEALLWGKMRETNSKIINNGIEISKFKADRSAGERMRKDLGIQGKGLIIGHVGGFRKEKNHAFLLKIFKKVRERRKDAILICVGSGGLKRRIEGIAKKMGLENNVIFTDQRTDVEKIIQCFDILVFPSLSEGFPTTLLEVQAAGIPVVASNTITDKLRLTDNFRSLSLKDRPEKWVEAVLSMPLKRDHEAYLKPEIQKYSITNTAMQLKEIYLKKHRP